MRRRLIQSTKLLSLAIAVLPACDKVGSHAEPTSTASAPSAVASAPSAVASAPTPDPAVFALAAELQGESRAGALARMDHYRPLCDDHGYPLVGNLAMKAPSDPKAMPPSELCAEVRKKK